MDHEIILPDTKSIKENYGNVECSRAFCICYNVQMFTTTKINIYTPCLHEIHTNIKIHSLIK